MHVDGALGCVIFGENALISQDSVINLCILAGICHVQLFSKIAEALPIYPIYLYTHTYLFRNCLQYLLQYYYTILNSIILLHTFFARVFFKHFYTFFCKDFSLLLFHTIFFIHIVLFFFFFFLLKIYCFQHFFLFFIFLYFY